MVMKTNLLYLNTNLEFMRKKYKLKKMEKEKLTI